MLFQKYLIQLFSNQTPETKSLPYKFIPSTKGKQLLMMNEYTYSQNAQTLNYYCSKKDSGCKARIKLNKDGRIKEAICKHFHAPPKYVINVCIINIWTGYVDIILHFTS
ncbi:hypothetical protein ABMA28_001400 [Loxostege sticticalis]|uniref:FLYWCH-type domain-containing protein n=1 Tax=Loxostege sticticalis TaxID=481309 RepID=A0ABD0T1L7_LOXSC